jgi:hypothetical protein
MPTYKNGFIPLDLLVVFFRGRNDVDGDYYHALSPATYARHLALVERARRRTGRKLVISGGWSAYRPYAAQVHAQQIWGRGAAEPGTSSHGGFWEGRQTLAMDYGNWAYVYGNGDGRDTPDKRAAFFDDCRAVGLSPNLISPQRGYPDEPWHVVDLDPWSAVPASVDVRPFPEEEPEDESEEDEMKLKGLEYTRKSDGKSVFMLFNEGSGFYAEHEGVDGSYNTALAQAWGTGDWPKTTESHANVIKNALNNVRTSR